MHSSAVFSDPPTDQPLHIEAQLVVDSYHQTEVRHPLSLETAACNCRVRIYSKREGVIIVLTEQPGERRLTDVYALQQIASEVLAFAVCEASRRDSITWIAHVPHWGAMTGQDKFFEIEFDRFLDDPKYLTEKTRFGIFSRSIWNTISRDHLTGLIGTYLE